RSTQTTSQGSCSTATPDGCGLAPAGRARIEAPTLDAVPLGKGRKRPNMINAILVVLDIAVALGLIFLVLLHSGRGGGLSDMFGGGQLGGSMAGSTVVERNLDRLTVIAGVIFMFTTTLLALRLK